MKVLWTAEAEADRQEIFDYIAVEDAVAAIRLDETFSVAAGRLGEMPYLGKPGRIAGTRELLPHPSYRLVYEIYAEAIWILALVHAARRWPP
ncbi:MAG TPA: type II toxin-antitoxin system RelE/ParE family toxin [Pararhizobium sp.]|nr:type II toxin-antitoxin system RelE/ParE family toxin [Pararhizobium sp.]